MLILPILVLSSYHSIGDFDPTGQPSHPYKVRFLDIFPGMLIKQSLQRRGESLFTENAQ